MQGHSQPDPSRVIARLRALWPNVRDEEVRIVRGPGRVNLIGEHTDYNGGLVLPIAIGLEIRIASVGTTDERFEIELEDGTRIGFSVADPGPPRGGPVDYLAGVALELARAGVALRGVGAVLESSLPQGTGLSSSAAIELAAAWILAVDSPPPVNGMELARLAQRAENDFVGVRCGLMDQAAVTLGRAGTALLLDCRSLEWEHIPLALGTARVGVIESGSRRRLAASAYNDRQAECEAAVAALASRGERVSTLRDVDRMMLERHAEGLDPTTRRRAMHVVAENARVIDAVAALRLGDLVRLGRLLNQSHASLRDLYEVSSPELDTLVDAAQSVPGVYGARMTGAGFGGAAVVLVEQASVGALGMALESTYRDRSGLDARLHVVEAVDGAGLAVA